MRYCTAEGRVECFTAKDLEGSDRVLNRGTVSEFSCVGLRKTTKNTG
jgi:hypothetical protein